MQQKKITFIGAGNMAQAIITGLLQKGLASENIIACNKTPAKIKNLADKGVITGVNNQQGAEKADIIILAVKPQIMAEACQSLSKIDLSNKLVISIAAGVKVAKIKELLPTASKIVRVMPNTPALLGQGVSGIFSENLSEQAAKLITELFETVGLVHWLKKESEINNIIALTGSSPAYFYFFMESMYEKAIELGFESNVARNLVEQAALGSVNMVRENQELEIEDLRKNVMSKGGTTAEAIKVFENAKLKTIIGEAMQKAHDRGEELENN